MNETITVKDGQAAVSTVAVSGTLSPKSSATDVITVVETADGKHAAVKVYNLNGGGGGGGSSEDIDALNNAASVLTTDVDLAEQPGSTTTVLLDELLAMSSIDGRPSYKEPGASVYSDNGVFGIIGSVNETDGTASVVTVSVSGSDALVIEEY